ncbi:MAG: glycosyltransferase [Tissierellia bacterium]|nr:glycosyltransferase [Tissierellia bacterium]
MKTITYIGRFTPAGGGVTAKNSAIFDMLLTRILITKIDLTFIKNGHIELLFTLLLALFRKKGRLIIGTAGKFRRIFSHWLYTFNRSTMKNSILMVMGGQFGDIVASDPLYQKWVRCYKMIYVETPGMMDTLHSVGVNNVSVFSNCRKKPETEILVRLREGKLKCVCFSMIYPEKGIDTALEAARQLPDVLFDFWGVVRDDYKSEFFTAINDLLNCQYRGVYSVKGDNVYTMLNQYDLLLFPTRLKGEGVPGSLIEAKIAALPAIVSNVAYNAQLVENGVSGLIMRGNTVKCLVESIKIAENNNELLERLKNGAKESGKQYYFEAHLKNLIEQF